MVRETHRLRPLILPAIAVVAFSVVFFALFYIWGGDAWSWYWWPFYPIGAIVIAFLVAAWTAARHERHPREERR